MDGPALLAMRQPQTSQGRFSGMAESVARKDFGAACNSQAWDSQQPRYTSEF